ARAYNHYRAESHELQISDESVAGNSNCECDLATPIVSSDDNDNGSIGLVKFMLLFAFFVLRDSYPASAAASDFATGLNLVPVFGDVGDLST
ncbi:GDT1-like protein 1 chloroplastic-like, partial [Trifolium medium]|nr:GDT1-like protein 1 chloroplastic-like [Trifolium medium]